jgi:hypothetical protein
MLASVIHHSGPPHGIDTLWGNTGFDGYLFDFDFAEDLFGVSLVTGLFGGPHGSEMATPLVPANLSHSVILYRPHVVLL